MILKILSLLSVATLWGITNPLIKKGTKEIRKIKAKSPFKQFLLEIKFLFTNWSYFLPMIINQCGSVLYFITLQTTELSLTVPVTNSLTFIITALTDWVLDRKLPNKSTCLGTMLVVFGTSLCFLDKMYN